MDTEVLKREPSQLIDLADRINQEHRACEQSLRSGLQHALECGRLLAQAKKQLAHGEWLPWLKRNCAVTPRAAQGYMRVASRWPQLEARTQHVSHLTYRQALALLTDERARPDRPTLPKLPVEEIELPTLEPGRCYTAVDRSHADMVEIHPNASNPDFPFVALYQDLDADAGASVEYTRRGLRVDALPELLRLWDFHPLGGWSSKPATALRPWYVDAPGRPAKGRYRPRPSRPNTPTDAGHC